MAAMSEKEPIVKYSWEGIKVGLEFSGMNGVPIDVEELKFRFIYRDQYGRTCEVSQEGDKRVNCVLRDGELIAVFEPNTFRKGFLTVDFNNKTTAHHFEASLAYVLPVEKFPLSIAWYTMFAGMDKNEKGDKNNYSSYVELNYPFSVKSVDLNVTCGIVPYKAPQYYTNGFAVTNVALKGSYAIKITDSFSLPIFSQVIWNPRMEDAHIVFGITLKP